MRILDISIPAGYLGLKANKLTNLGKVVLLAGPNGSGKSRILTAVHDYASNSKTDEEKNGLKQEISNMRARLGQIKSQFAAVEKTLLIATQTQDVINKNQTLKNFDLERNRLEKQIIDIEQQLEKANSIKLSPSSLKPVVVHYNVRNHNLTSWRQNNQNDTEQLSSSVKSEFNINIVSNSGISAVHQLITNKVALEHPETKRSSSMVETLEQLNNSLERLRGLIKDFLGTTLTWDQNFDPMIFGRSMSDAGLSVGQRVLLQIALQIFFQNGDRDELILLLDEPENHLHAASLTSALEKIQAACPNAQLWIASHSVPLLSQYDESSLWFTKDGSVEYGRHQLAQITESLLGGKGATERLATFVGMPEAIAVVRFAAECLIPATVADTPAGDPQTSQISMVLDTISQGDTYPRILDFGIGRGRLLTELSDRCNTAGKTFGETYDYYGYDIPTSPYAEECISRLKKYYPNDAARRLLLGRTALRSVINRESVNVVIMCNTLHELPLDDWLNYFGSEGILRHVLHPDGSLLIVEDQILSVGETAHRFGFLVLDRLELCKLFNLPNESNDFKTYVHSHEKYARRLKAHRIPASALVNVSRATIKDAIMSLADTAQYEAESISTTSIEEHSAKGYAFWTQQYFNARRALKSLA